MKQDYWTYNKPLSMTGFGGGATSLSNAGAALFSYDDAAYNNFFSKGKAPIDIVNTSSDYYNGTSSDVDDGLGKFYDTNQQKIYTTYGTVRSYGWSYSSGTYASNANYYRFSSTHTDFSGWYTSSVGGGSRDIVVAYLQDDTPVFVVVDGYRLVFYNYPAGTYINDLYLNSGGLNNPAGYHNSNLAFDGTYLIYHDNFKFYYYDMPANTASIGGYLSRTLKYSAYGVSSNTTPNYGLVSGGGNILYLGTEQGATKFTLSAANGLNGSATESTLYAYNSSGAVNYSLGMDYKNRKLILGGFGGRDLRVYGE